VSKHLPILLELVIEAERVGTGVDRHPLVVLAEVDRQPLAVLWRMGLFDRGLSDRGWVLVEGHLGYSTD
jgi:hypothetical protein